MLRRRAERDAGECPDLTTAEKDRIRELEREVRELRQANEIKGDTVNLSHGPIKDIGWPAMTMDLQLLDGAEVGDVKAGDTVMIMLEKGDDGMYGICALMPK